MIASTLFIFAGCSDIVAGAGEFGRITYHLNTPFEIEEFILTEAKLVTGYSQEIQTNLTPGGYAKSEQPYLIRHSSETAGAMVDSHLLDELIFNVPDFSISSSEPGDVVVESRLEGALFDRITLGFEMPDDLEIISWIRDPGEADFSKKTGGAIDVDLGSQITMLPIPTSEGKRLAGAVEVSIEASPVSSFVQNFNIEEVGEDGVVANQTPVSFFFVEPGLVEITITDIVNNVSTIQEYQVSN